MITGTHYITTNANRSKISECSISCPYTPNHGLSWYLHPGCVNLRGLLGNLLLHWISKFLKDHFITFTEAGKLFEIIQHVFHTHMKEAGAEALGQSLRKSPWPCRKKMWCCRDWVHGYLFDMYFLSYTACENTGQLDWQNRLSTVWDNHIVLKQLWDPVNRLPQRLRLKTSRFNSGGATRTLGYCRWELKMAQPHCNK